MLNPIGGNWIGKAAAADLTPLDTLLRELKEELVLGGSPDHSELVDLGLTDRVDPSDTVPGVVVGSIDPIDIDRLDQVRLGIQESLKPWGSYLHYVPRRVLDEVDPLNKKGDTTVLVCYWVSPASFKGRQWATLEALQAKYGNLVNEGETVVTSLDQIVEQRLEVAWGHDQALRDFWRSHGFDEAKGISRIQGIESSYAGPIPENYEELQRQYDVLRTPFTT